MSDQTYIELLKLAHEKIAELEKRLSNAETMGDKAQSIRDLEQQAKGIEFAIDAGIDFQQIENDVAVCNAIRTRAKAKALKEGK
jgi:hypothetical protein